MPRPPAPRLARRSVLALALALAGCLATAAAPWAARPGDGGARSAALPGPLAALAHGVDARPPVGAAASAARLLGAPPTAAPDDLAALAPWTAGARRDRALPRPAAPAPLERRASVARRWLLWGALRIGGG